MGLNVAGFVDVGFIRSAVAAACSIDTTRVRLDAAAISTWVTSAAAEFDGSVVRTYWYDAAHPVEDPKFAPQKKYLEAVSAIPGLQLRLGQLVSRTPPWQPQLLRALDAAKVDRAVFDEHFTLTAEQVTTGSSTLLVLDLLRLAQRRVYDVAVLFTGDRGLLEAVRAAQEEGARIVLVVPDDRSVAPELRALADRVLLLKPDQLQRLHRKSDQRPPAASTFSFGLLHTGTGTQLRQAPLAADPAVKPPALDNEVPTAEPGTADGVAPDQHATNTMVVAPATVPEPAPAPGPAPAPEPAPAPGPAPAPEPAPASETVTVTRQWAPPGAPVEPAEAPSTGLGDLFDDGEQLPAATPDHPGPAGTGSGRPGADLDDVAGELFGDDDDATAAPATDGQGSLEATEAGPQPVAAATVAAELFGDDEAAGVTPDWLDALAGGPVTFGSAAQQY